MPKKSNITPEANEQNLDQTPPINSDYLEREKAIKTEVSRLKRLFKDIDPDRLKLVHSTIQDVAFISVTMEYLRDDINKYGTVEPYKNGANQYGVKQSANAQLYLQFSQKLNQAQKLLISCLPNDENIKREVANEMDIIAFAKRK